MGIFVSEMKNRATHFIQISFHHVDCRANMVAHLIARERFKISNDRFWVEDVSEVAIAVVNGKILTSTLPD
ncbi:hypothetical protein PVK06_040584 [Gossypium arboreum]|uniref:RNase H type-1 domain-containing protein n=1 Tax=Gossypium arboreum TaxID=29729 RepID=A0ABR0N5V9_GOSAR|nr:hypothetical protein PVK06_040584 [Gossypium arboreum]